MSSPAAFELSPWHKRQAAILYHYTSLGYLKGLLPRVEELIARADALLDDRERFDPHMRAIGWDTRDTAANWATWAYPALVEFKESLLKDIALRAVESYDITDANNASRMLREYSMNWAEPDQEEEFREFAEKEVFKYASPINAALLRPRTDDDYTYYVEWKRSSAKFSRLPCFRVRTDVEAETDGRVPRTGVYIPQDDPYGAAQFAWAGGRYGQLDDCMTFNDVGLEAVSTLGRQALWDDGDALLRFAEQPKYKGRFVTISGDPPKTSVEAVSAVAWESFTERPCKWYYVEMLPDRYETHDGTYVGGGEAVAALDTKHRLRLPAGAVCPYSGRWFTPAKSDSLRTFKAGDVFPDIHDTDYGDVYWQWHSE